MIDAHCHLPPDLSAARNYLAAMRAAGVTGCTACAVSEDDWERLLQLAETEPGLRVELGIHPWYLSEARPGWPERLEKLLRSTAAGVGEVGLDRLRGGSLENQEENLRNQLQLAWDLQRPASLHCVQAWGMLLPILRSFGHWQGRLLVHGFTGSPETGRELIALGCRLSLGPRLLEARHEKLRGWLTTVDRQWLAVETDASTAQAWADPATAAARLQELADSYS